MSPRRTLALLLAVLAGMSFVAFTRLDVSTDITNMMPSGSAGTLARLSRELAQSELARSMVLSIEADTTALAVAAAKELAARLRGRDDVAWVRDALEEEQLRALHALYFPRRHGFLTDRPEELPAILSDAGLAERAEALKRELASPISPLAKQVASADPLGAFRGVIERFRGTRPELAVVGGQFVSADGLHAILFLGTRPSAFDAKAQRQFLERLRADFDGLAAHSRGRLTLESSGANKFAVAAETSIRGDVQLVAVLGTLLVAALLLAFYATPGGFVMVSLPTVAGILVATGTGSLVFGRLDGITLGFGAALIGVVIDYPTHLLTQLVLAPAGATVQSVVVRHRGAIWLGGLTTVASFVGLGLTSFRGFQQIAFFSAVGVLSALVVTLHVLPAFWRMGGRTPRLAAWCAARLELGLDAMRERRGALLALGGGALLFAIPALSGLNWTDDLSRLWRMDPALQAEDERVRGRIGQDAGGRFVLAVAKDSESALRANDAVHARLAAAVAAGALEGQRSLHTLLWSRRLQEENQRAVWSDPTLPIRLDRVFTQAGFRPDAFAAFARELALPPPAPLSYEDLLASPLADLVRSTLVQLGDDVAAITSLSGVRDPDSIRAAVSDLPGTHLFDQRTYLTELYAAFRTTTVEQVFVGNLLVIALLIARYRRLRPALAAFVPSALAATVLLGSFALAGVETNLLHAVGLVIVTGMGVDYGVFLVDAVERREGLGPTMLSVLVCGLTTVFTFGVMAVSEHPALRAIGVTIGAGVMLACLLAPVAMLLVRGDAAGDAGSGAEPAATPPGLPEGDGGHTSGLPMPR